MGCYYPQSWRVMHGENYWNTRIAVYERSLGNKKWPSLKRHHQFEATLSTEAGMCPDFICLSPSLAKVAHWLNPAISLCGASWCCPRGCSSWYREQGAKGRRVDLAYIWHSLCPRPLVRERQSRLRSAVSPHQTLLPS